MNQENGVIADLLRDHGFDEAAEKFCNAGSDYKIVVCQRGFIYAGFVELVGEYIVITDAVNIRRWGTTTGLGQLALHGRQNETVLDKCGTMRVHELAVVHMLDCDKPLSG